MSNTTPYLTISVETFKKYWTLMTAAMANAKTIRNYEEYVLLEGRREDDIDIFTMRVSQEMSGLRIVLRGDDIPAVFVLGNPFSLAIKIETITSSLPFLKGELRIESVEKKKGIVCFAAGSMRQELHFSDDVAEDFPGEQLFDQEKIIQFKCTDLDRRIRLALGSASRDTKAANSLSSAVFFQIINSTELSMISAGAARGISQVRWKPIIRESVESFNAAIPLSNMYILARAAVGYKDDIVVRGDPGSGLLVWEFGRMSYQCRSIGEKFFSLDSMYGGTVVAEASVIASTLADVLGLICVQTPSNDTGKATLAMQPDGTVLVTSPSTATAVEATLNGMCSGTLPHMLTLNAPQVREIIADLKHKDELLHFQAQISGVRNYPLLQITAPSDPDFMHIAILIETVVERKPD